MTEHAWYTLPDGRSVYRPVVRTKPSKRSAFPCPQIRRDEIAPTRSMANGQEYTSLSALRSTYKADGNPQREDYIEIGDAPMTGGPKPKRISKKEVADLYDKSVARISRGDIPQVGSITDPL